MNLIRLFYLRQIEYLLYYYLLSFCKHSCNINDSNATIVASIKDQVQINVSQKDMHLIQVAEECRYIARMLGLNLLKIESISSCNGSKFTINHDIAI
jgi:hypothetical protein